MSATPFSSLAFLFLDVGGVLANPNWERVAAALGEQGIDARAEDLRAAEPRAKRRLDRAEHVRRSDDDSRGVDLFHYVLEQAGIEAGEGTAAALATVREYHARHNLWERVPPGVEEGLVRLRALGLPLTVVSNANGTLHHHLARLGLATFFDVVIDSFEEGVEKPDPRIFEIALDRAGADRGSTLHVGDLYEIDVVGARAAGIDAVLVDAADLYPRADCSRFPSFAAFVDRLEAERR